MTGIIATLSSTVLTTRPIVVMLSVVAPSNESDESSQNDSFHKTTNKCRIFNKGRRDGG
jgi:hypothetical protein